MENLAYYKFRKQGLICKNCQFHGMGIQFTQGELFKALFELNCPECKTLFGTVTLPSEEEVLKYGSKADKERIIVAKKFNEALKASQLADAKVLENQNDLLALEFKESFEDGNIWIEMFLNNKLVWKEMAHYEYYYRLIELMDMLNSKFPGKIKSIDYEKTSYLLGDYIPASDKIKSKIDEIIK